MKTLTKRIIVLFTIITILIFTGYSNESLAVDGGRVSLHADNTPLTAGGVINITVSLSEFGDGINSISGGIEYDKNVFEEITKSDITCLGNWSQSGIMYNAENGRWVVENSGTVSGGELFKVAFRVKTNLNSDVTGTTITFKNIRASRGAGDITPINVSMEIGSATQFKDYVLVEYKYLTRVKPETTVDEFKTHIITNKTIQVLNSQGTEITGSEIVATGMTVKIGEAESYKIVVTGDVSGDGKLKIDDLSIMQMYIVKLITLDPEYVKALDFDYDEKVNIMDLSLMCMALVGLYNL